MKRLFTRFLLSAMLVMSCTTAWAQMSVLDESFASGGLPGGWTQGGSYWKFSDGNAKFEALFENAADTLFSPLLSLSDLDNKPSVAVTYSNMANGDKVNELKVLYRGSESAEWTEWKSFGATDGQASLKDELPEGLANVQIALAGAYKGGTETRVYRLAVENKTEATTAPTGLTKENLTTTGVTLLWDACTSPKFVQYNVKVSTVKMTDMSAEADVVDNVGWMITDEFYELSNLKPNTPYWLYVQYDCGNGDVSPWAEYEFQTPCAAISAPYSTDFEEGLPDCFTVFKQGSATTAEVSGEYPYNSTKSFKVNIEGTTGFYNYLILPELTGNVKDYQLSFMAGSEMSGNTYSRRVAVGVCSDASDVATFTEIATLDLPKGRQWENIVVSLKGYAGEGKYITLKIGHPSKKTNLYIDNIKVETASACPKPMFVEVTAITPEGATIGWTKTGSETEWNLVLSTKPLTNPEDIEPDATKGEFAGSVSTNPYTLANLQPNTTYYAYLQAGCGSSEWTEAVTFKTAREVSYPYVEHFDRMDPELYTNNTAAIPSGWVFDDRTTLASDASYYDKQYSSDSYRPYVTTKQNHEATAYVKASLLLRGTGSGTGSTKNISSIAIAPAMPKAVNTMMVTFWAYSSAAQTVKIGVANTQTNDLAQGQQLGANITEVGEAAITGGSEWKQYKVLLTGYTGTGRYIAFYLNPGTSTPSVYIDDIEIDEAPDCNAVSTLTAEATGIDKATVEWTDASSSTSWIVKVSSTEIDPASADGDVIAAQTVTAKTYNLTGLAMGGTYYIYVSPTCGDAWMSTSVTTLVGLQVPYYNDFTSENTGANATRGPKNWTLGFTYTDAPGATSSYWPHVNTTAWTNAPADVVKNSVYFNNSTSASGQFPYAIMPELLNGNVKDMKIGFYAYWNNAKPSSPANYACKNDSYYGVLKIGVVSSPTDINKTNKFTKVTEVAAVRCKEPKAAEYFVVDMSSYTGDGKYIVFYQDTAKNNYMMIDNLYVGPKSEPVPAVAIADLKYTELTTTGATLAWKEQGEATKWNVRVFTEKQDDPEIGTPVFSTTVDNTPAATITGLKHSTQYYAYVQSSQSNGNGVWVSTMFWTDCEKAPLPFTADFNSFEHGSTSLNTLSWCYMVGDNYGGTSPYYYNYVKNGQATTSSTTATGPGTSYYYIDHTYGNDPATNTFYMYAPKDKYALLVLPEVDGDLAELTMRFYGCYSTAFSASSSSGGAIEVAIMNADGTFTHVENFKLSKAKDWEEFNLNFPSDIHSGRIAFRINNTADWRTELGSTYSSGATFYMYIDDIKVQQIPQCQKVLDIEVSDVDSVSAKISWAESEASAWNLKISTVELADPDAATADVFDGAIETTPSKLIDNLADNTVHYVYVQTVRPEKSCVGEWSQAKVFKTLCRKQNFPYVEDFEGYPTGSGNLPDCATLSGQTPDHSYVTTRGTGNQALYLRQATKDYNNYFAFPALSVDSVKRLQLSMQVAPGYTTATNTYYYEVGVMTDPNNPSTFVSIAYDSVQGAANYPFSDKMYTFEGYKGDENGKFGTYIALKPLKYATSTNANAGAGYVYIDNVTIDFIETCFKPTDVTGEIGTDTVKLSWNSDNKGASYLVRLFADADDDPDTATPVAETTVDTTMAVIRNLAGNTTYYAYVQALCSETDKSKWSTVYQFKTECPEVTPLPYADDFEAYDSNTVPDCWEPLDNGTNAKSRVSTTYKFSGAKSLIVNYASKGSSSGNSYYQSQIVTPALDVENLKDVLVYFNMRSGSAGGSLKIEAVSDETSQAEAITLTQINDIPDDWTVAYLDLAKYYTSVQPYKRLRFTPTAQGKSIYIDDIVFTTNKSTVLPVQDLKLSMVTETTAKFSFVEYTPSVTEWQVAYVAAGGDIADATILPVTTKEYTITGLAANTSYDIYVRGNVEGAEWVGPLTATTIQTPAPLPLITGFEDDADKWVIYKTKTVQGNSYPNFFIVGDADNCGATGEKALFITNDSISYAYQTKDAQGEIGFSNAWATRNINIEGAGTYKFKFKVKVPGNKGPDADHQDNDYATAHLFPAGATIIADKATMLDGTTRSGSAVTDVPASNIYSLMDKTYQKDEWIWVSKSIDVEEAGIYTLAIFWYNASVGAQYGEAIAVDSVIVEEYLCSTPKNFEFVERKANTATISWFGGKCKNFEYVVSKYANLGMPNMIEAEDKVAAGTLTDGPQVTITDLLPNTEYSLYVRTICPDGETDWVEYDFETPCALEVLPYTESFTETPECWILKSASVGTTQVGTGSSDYEKWNRLQLSNGGIAILPELAVDLKNVEIEIGLFNITTALGAVQLGVMDNTWDESTFEEIAYIQTVNKPGSTGTYTPSVLETFSKMMNLYQGTGKVLAIKNATTSSIGIRYVKLTELPDCVKPQQVEITYPTENAVTVNWIAGLEEAWEILLDDSIIENVTTNPYRVTGLEQGTVYTVAVRALCDEDTKSEWSLPTTFQTPCGVNPLPMNEDFSALPNPPGSSNLARATLTCWDNLVSTNKIEQVFKGTEKPFPAPGNIYAGQTWVQNWISMLGDYAQLHSYHGVYNPTYRYKWFISPQYAIEGNATLSFDVRRCGNKGQKVEFDAGRFFVAISTDNGATWKETDATQITEIDTVYSTKSISLGQYAGKAIRVAFYDENSAGSYDPANFLLIDNVRMNCTEEYAYTDNACQGYAYEGYGFSIAAEDLPEAGEESTYTRFAVNAENGCDSVVTLTLTTRTASEVAPVYATICEGEVYEFGPFKLTEPNPEGQPYYISGENQYGCDSTIYLYLTVNKADTVDYQGDIVESLNSLKDGPKKIDDYFSVPDTLGIGEYEFVVKHDGCNYYRYYVSIVEKGTGLINVGEGVDRIDIYDILGRKVHTLRQGDEQYRLPTGVYMLRTIMNSGKAESRKVTVK